MNKTFCIDYKDQQITIEHLPADKHDNLYYVAHLSSDKLMLEYTEDDEGAGHWIDLASNHETDVSNEIGKLIELYRIQQKLNA